MQTATPRHNIYAFIHKALRLMMADTLPLVGRLDVTDPVEVSETIVRVRELLAFCKHHLEIENALVHPAIEARSAGATSRIAHQHVEHQASLTALERSLQVVARAPMPVRAAAAADLYAKLALFVGENLVHMNEEETVHNRALWDAYSDEELIALENSIKASHSPDETKLALRWMLPAMSPAERAMVLAGVRNNAPPPVYEGIVALARACVDAAGVRKLENALAA
jgi:hypothetical protein